MAALEESIARVKARVTSIRTRPPSDIQRSPPAPALVSIGVYGWTREAFIATLKRSDVGLLLDIRQRRGVRGPRYAWANSRRLQAALSDADIAYRHERQLAPTTELRQLQYRADELEGVGKRNRVRLAPEYRRRYAEEILAEADLDALMERLPLVGCSALLCVERDPEACHRSIIAETLQRRFGVWVSHLVPIGPGS